MKCIRIALTGGPGGGKTEALSFIQNELAKEGIRVITVPEAASELILAGLSPRGILTNFDFQAAQLDLQLQREDIYTRAALRLPDELVVILCDRGALDGKGFIENEKFEAILAERNLQEDQLLKRYAAVFHLTSAAAGASGLYTRSNNPARKETPSQALSEDEKLIGIWQKHPHYYQIPVYPTLDEKLAVLIGEIRKILEDLQNQPEESLFCEAN